MPKKLEKALMKSAEARGIKRGSDRWKRYVYGTLSRVESAKKKGKN